MTGLQEVGQSTKRTAPRDVRRKQLIMAAMDSISKRGFSDTTLKHVTEKAKLSHGVVNYHFESKEALYDATLGYLVKEHYEIWVKYQANAGSDPARQIESIIKADFDKKVCTPKKLAVWFAFWGQAKYRPNYLKIHNNYDNERHSVLENLCREVISDGNYSNIGAAQAARIIEALTDGYWLDLMLYPSDANRIRGRQECLQTLASMFPNHFSAAQSKFGGVCQETK